MSPMARRRMVLSAAVLALGGATGADALGADALAALPSVTASGSPRCSVSSAALAARVASGVIGDIDPELRIAVVLRDSANGTTAKVSVSLGERQLGQRRLVAADCDEALEAVVAVTALALSSTGNFVDVDAEATSALGEKDEADEMGGEHELTLRRSRSAHAEQLAPDVATASTALEAATPIDQRPSSEAGADAARVSILFGTGVDVVGDSAGLVSAGAALRVGGGSWRAQLWYGLPSFAEEEDALPLRSLKTRSERAAAAFDYCRDIDSGGWLGVCAGLELGVVRHWRAEALEGEARSERRRFDPRLAAAVGARFTYPHARVQPGLELSTLLPVLGSGTAGVGLRAQAGVAVPF